MPVAQTPEPQEASDGERASLKEKKLRLSQRWEAVVRSDDAKADQRRRSSRLVVTSAARQGVKEVASGFGTLGPPPRWLKPLVEAGANCDELVAALEAHDRELASTPTKARDAEDEARGATWLAGLRSAALETGRAEAEFGDVVVSVRRRRRGGSAPPGAAGGSRPPTPPTPPKALDFSAAVREDDAPPAVTPESASRGAAPDPPDAAVTPEPAAADGGAPAGAAAAADEGAPAEADDDLAGAWDDVAAGDAWAGRLTPSFDDGDADDDATDAEPERPATPPTGLASPAPPADEALSPRGPGRLLQCWMGCGGPFDFLKRGTPTPTRAGTPVSRASTPPVDYDAGAVADHWS